MLVWKELAAVGRRLQPGQPGCTGRRVHQCPVGYKCGLDVGPLVVPTMGQGILLGVDTAPQEAVKSGKVGGAARRPSTERSSGDGTLNIAVS